MIEGMSLAPHVKGLKEKYKCVINTSQGYLGLVGYSDSYKV